MLNSISDFFGFILSPEDTSSTRHLERSFGVPETGSQWAGKLKALFWIGISIVIPLTVSVF